MNYTDAPEGFQPLAGFDDAPPGFKPIQTNPYNDEGESWSEQPSKPFNPDLALQNAPQSAFNTAKRVAADILPGQHVQTGFALAQPGGLSNAWEGLKQRFGGWENIKRTAEQDPVGLGYDAVGVLAGGKSLPRAAAPAGAMPRAVVREGAELLSTGGKRMTEAKLNPATVPANDIAGPMQKFRDTLKTEAAIDLDTAELAPALSNRIKRIEGAYAPPKRDPMANVTKREPGANPPISLSELHGHSKGLDKFINSTGKTEGRINEQGFVALELKKAVDEMIDLHPESGTFKIGKHEFHRGAMNREMEDLLERAQGRAQWKNGDQAGALSGEISAFLKAKKNRYKLTPDARSKLGKLSHDSGGRLVGAFGLSNNSFGGNVFARGIETAVFGFPGALAPIGQATRASRNARILQEFQKIQEELRAGGPVGK
jgi:hypothetical protein